jgi:hypothetical protein
MDVTDVNRHAAGVFDRTDVTSAAKSLMMSSDRDDAASAAAGYDDAEVVSAYERIVRTLSLGQAFDYAVEHAPSGRVHEYVSALKGDAFVQDTAAAQQVVVTPSGVDNQTVTTLFPALQTLIQRYTRDPAFVRMVTPPPSTDSTQLQHVIAQVGHLQTCNPLLLDICETFVCAVRCATGDDVVTAAAVRHTNGSLAEAVQELSTTLQRVSSELSKKPNEVAPNAEAAALMGCIALARLAQV